MLLQKLQLKNAQGSVLDLPLEGGPAGYFVEKIDGLGPVKATLVSTGFAGLDGAQYQTARRMPRNLNITLGLDPDFATFDPSDLRDELYNFLTPPQEATFLFSMYDRFTNDASLQNVELELKARVEDVPATIFAQRPSVNVVAQAFKPNFVDPTLRTFEGSTTDDLTETPFTYTGKIETGFVFILESTRAMTELTIYHRRPDNTLRMAEFDGAIADAETLKISSVQGNKYVTLKSAVGVESSVLYSLTPQSAWLELYPGVNNFRVYNSEGVPVPYRIEYYNQYGGL